MLETVRTPAHPVINLVPFTHSVPTRAVPHSLYHTHTRPHACSAQLKLRSPLLPYCCCAPRTLCLTCAVPHACCAPPVLRTCTLHPTQAALTPFATLLLCPTHAVTAAGGNGSKPHLCSALRMLFPSILTLCSCHSPHFCRREWCRAVSCPLAWAPTRASECLSLRLR